MAIDNFSPTTIGSNLIGLEALPLVANLPQLLVDRSHRSIETLRFKIYRPTPLLEERIKDSDNAATKKILERASELRATWRTLTSTDLPFWDSISAASLVDGHHDLLIQEATRHDPQCEKKEVLVKDLSMKTLEKLAEGLPATSVLGLYSSCRLSDGSTEHIPMMDFRGTPSPEHLARIKTALHTIQQTRGVILKSGRSYHFYGFVLLDHKRWLTFMADCLLLAPLTDSRYIAHRLIEGEAVLRLIRSDAKPEIPSVVDVL